MQGWMLILELIGTVAFSVSGAMTGIKKHMDIFGVVILGLTAAVGGGIIRDIILGINPPTTFRNPIYATFAIITAMVLFLPAVRNKVTANRKLHDVIMLIMDSIGLGIFTVVGIRTAYTLSDSFNLFLLIFVGVITGVGGGVLRDMLAGNTPYIFVKHIYACASLAGAIICAFMWDHFSDVFSMLTGMCVVILIRLLSAKYKWNLPHA